MAQFDIAMPDGSTGESGRCRLENPSKPEHAPGCMDVRELRGSFMTPQGDSGVGSPGLDASDWKPSTVFAPALKVSAERDEPNRLEAELRAVEVTEPQEGVYRFDMAGISPLGRAQGRQGGRVTGSISNSRSGPRLP